MVFNTKFNVGDKLFTIDRETMKVRNFTVKSVCIISSSDKASISYVPEGDDVWKPNIPEERCFDSKEALFEYIESSEQKSAE